jgi:hypothetical protein
MDFIKRGSEQVSSRIMYLVKHINLFICALTVWDIIVLSNIFYILVSFPFYNTNPSIFIRWCVPL